MGHLGIGAGDFCGEVSGDKSGKKNCGEIIFTRYSCYMCVKLLWQGYFVNAVIFKKPSNPDKLNLVLEGFTLLTVTLHYQLLHHFLYIESLVKLQSEFDT